MAVKVIEVNKDIFALNDEMAEKVREINKENKTFMVNIMASPGAGKTTTLLRTIEDLKEDFQIGVMEADIEATVDAEVMEKAGVKSIQIHTGGECAMTAEMVMQGLMEFDTKDMDILFLENVGNLVCPAEEDTGASINVAILSVPEGDDKPLKYPLMFEMCQVVIINKIDTKMYFKFDDEAVIKRIKDLNPKAEILFISAKTGEGVKEWTNWLKDKAGEWKK
jgi:hydrogenase nickel incorporation protein HypB